MRLIILLLALPCLAADRQVAITIDDLPRGGDGGGASFEAIRDMTVKLLKPFHDGVFHERRVDRIDPPRHVVGDARQPLLAVRPHDVANRGRHDRLARRRDIPASWSG